MSRRNLAIVLVVTIVASVGAGWVAASRIRSPAEVAARTAPPEAAPIVVPVESRVLSTDVVTRGTARFGSPQQLVLAPTALKSTVSVVDSVPLAGAELREGDIVLTASGRPVFLLQGDQPSYRDLGPGLAGQDVLQLEEALTRIGFDAGPVDGVYDEATEAGVSALYFVTGYQALEATEDQLASIRSLELDLANARLEILGPRDSVAAAASDLSAATAAQSAAAAASAAVPATLAAASADAEAANTAARAEVRAREVAVEAARQGSPASAPARAELASAEADVANAQTGANATRLAGQQAIAAAQAALNGAPGALAATEAEAAANDSAANAEVEARQAALDVVLENPDATPAEIAVAEAELATAVATADSIRFAGQQAVAAAQTEFDAAARDLAAAEAEAAANDSAADTEVTGKQATLDAVREGTPATPGTPAEIAGAEADLAKARADAESVRLAGEQAIRDARIGGAAATADVQAAGAAVGAARTSLGLANEAVSNRRIPEGLVQSDLDSAEREAGVQIPADEIIFVATDTVRVSEVTVSRGDDAIGPLMSVTDAIVAIDGSLALDEAPFVEAGMSVEIDEPDLGIAAQGVVNLISAAPGTNGVDGFHIYFEILVDDAPPSLVGASVRLTLPVESTGENVLAVPSGAVTLDVDGSSQIQVDREGVLETVIVEPGLSANGFVGITVLEGSLDEGDLVVVGTHQAAASADGTGG